jgi:hypothetical protein
MKPRIFVPVMFAIALALTTSNLAWAQRVPIAQMVRVQGTVEIKPDGKPTYRRVKVDELLYRGDLLRAVRGSRGVFRCIRDSTTWTVPADGLPRGVANYCSPASGF